MFETIAEWLAAHILYTSIIAFFGGGTVAWAYAMYMIEVARRRALRAAGWDLTIMFFAHVITLTLWAKTGDSVFVLLGYILGNATGTYIVTKVTKHDKDGK